MGFLDKAKKLAEQAQTKLDEVQKQVNTGGSSASGPAGPVVEYDKHGRPIPQQQAQTASPPHGDPLTSAPPASPASTGPTLDPSAPPQGGWSAPPAPPVPPSPPLSSGPPVTPTEPPSGSPAPVEASVPPPAPPGVPAAPSSPPAAPQGLGTEEEEEEEEDRNKPSYAPPKLTGGDPLAG